MALGPAPRGRATSSSSSSSSSVDDDEAVLQDGVEVGFDVVGVDLLLVVLAFLLLRGRLGSAGRLGRVDDLVLHDRVDVLVDVVGQDVVVEHVDVDTSSTRTTSSRSTSSSGSSFFGGGAGVFDGGLPARDTDTRDPNALDILVGEGQAQSTVLDWRAGSPVVVPMLGLRP